MSYAIIGFGEIGLGHVHASTAKQNQGFLNYVTLMS
jgi:hypothetical protein